MKEGRSLSQFSAVCAVRRSMRIVCAKPLGGLRAQVRTVLVAESPGRLFGSTREKSLLAGQSDCPRRVSGGGSAAGRLSHGVPRRGLAAAREKVMLPSVVSGDYDTARPETQFVKGLWWMGRRIR